MRIGIDIDDVITNTSETMKDYIMKDENSEEIKKHMVEIMIGKPIAPCAREFVKDNYIDLMIDDSVKHCEAVSNENIKSIVFTTEVNKNIKTKVPRVSNWIELEKKIREDVK